MNCFKHTSEPAVGICKACHKGICTECAVDVGGGLACKSECEEEVTRLNAMIKLNMEKGSKILSISSPIGGILFYLAAGIVFVFWGIADDLSFSIALGSLFILFGIFWSIRALVTDAKLNSDSNAS